MFRLLVVLVLLLALDLCTRRFEDEDENEDNGAMRSEIVFHLWNLD